MNGLRHALPFASGLGGAAAALAALATLATTAASLLQRERDRLADVVAQVAVQVADADPARQAARSATIAAMLARRTDVTDVHAIPSDALAAKLGLRSATRLPAVIEARLVGRADERGLRRTLAEQPGVAVMRDGQDVQPLADAAAGLRGIAGAIAVLALAGAIVCAVRAGRALLRERMDAILTLRRLGARDGQVAAAVQWRVAVETGIGAMTGTIVAAAAIPFIATQLAVAEGPAMTGQAIDPRGWLALAAIPPLIALLMAVATRATLQIALGRLR